MVRYRGDNEGPGQDESPGEVPGSYNGPSIWPPIVWTLIAMAVLVVLTLLAHRAN